MSIWTFNRAVALALSLAAVVSAQEVVRAAPGVAGRVNFSFEQADVRLVIKLVGELTGRTFVVPETVQGKVTLITPAQVSMAEVYPLFLVMLESAGYTVVDQEGSSTVVPLPPGTLWAGKLAEDGKLPDGLITKVIKLQYVSAAEVKKNLEGLVRGGKEGALSAFGPSNHLVVTDTADNIARLEKIIAELDKAGASSVIEIVALKHASAEEIATQIDKAMRGMDSAVNKVNRHFEQIAAGAAAMPTDFSVVAAPQANSVILIGAPLQLSEMKRIIAQMDVESVTGYGRLNVIFLKYLSAEEAAKSLTSLITKNAEKDPAGTRKMAIEPSVANNALLVDAAPQDFEYVRRLVERLDQLPEQVLVEVLIAEINLNKSLDLGVEWQWIDIPTEDSETTVIGRSRPGENDDLMSAITKGVFPQGLGVGIAHGTYTDPDGVVRPQVPIFIKALAGNKDIKILSNIPLWAQNNSEATVSVVNNIPVLKSTVEGSGSGRDYIQNIERMDVGIKLKLTPHVNPDGEIQLDLNPSIEAITDEGPEDIPFAPTIAKREVKTLVTIPDKATVVISGLIREDRIKTVNKVPLLGDIPLLGWLFRSNGTKRERTNLMIFVTPQIVKDMKTADCIREKLEHATSLTNATTEIFEPVAAGEP